LIGNIELSKKLKKVNTYKKKESIDRLRSIKGRK